MISFGSETEKFVISWIEKNGLAEVLILVVLVYVISVALSGVVGWQISGVTRVANLRKSLAETAKLNCEVKSQQDITLQSIRASRDSLVKAETQINNALRELRNSLEKGHNLKAENAREAACALIGSDFGRALEDHCEKIEYLLSGRLRNREVTTHVISTVRSVVAVLDTINSDELLACLSNTRSKYLLKRESIFPINQTLRLAYPWYKLHKIAERRAIVGGLKRHRKS